MLGSGGMIVFDEDTCMVKSLVRIIRFYAHESCGWCIPCREGTTWLRKLLMRFHAGQGQKSDIDLIGDIGQGNVRPHVLRFGRRGGDAHDVVCREVPRRVRSPPGWELSLRKGT